MFVYLVYEHYYDGAECWNNVLEVFKDETAAELYALELNEKDGYSDQYSSRSYKIQEMELR